jgi:hypothetical protein
MIQKIRSRIEGLISRILYPGFLRSIERFLLLNHPELWVTRFYRVIYYLLLVNVFVIAIAVTYPMKLHHVVDLGASALVVLGMLEFVALTFYAARTALFNSEPEYGDSYKLQGLVEVLTYMACAAIIASPSFLGTLIIRHRVTNLVSEVELIKDMKMPDVFGDIETPTVTTCNEMLEKNRGEFELDSVMVERYTGQVIRSDEEAEAQYCNALSNAGYIYQFAYKKGSVIMLLIRTLHLYFISLGWFVFTNAFVRGEFVSYLMAVFVLFGAFFFVLYAVLRRLLPYAFAGQESTGLVLALWTWVFTVLVLWRVVRIGSLDRHSALSSLSVVAFPVALGFSILMFLILLFGDPQSLILYMALSIAAYLPFTPFLKGQLIKLQCLPEG